MNPLIEKTISFVKDIFEKEYSGHDYFHTMRVYNMATRLAESENANLLMVQLAALLHDVDDMKLSPETYEGKDRAISFMRENLVDEEMIETVVKIISQISFAGSGATVPDTIEGKCVQDADRLDAVGALGIARAFAYGGNHNRIMYDPDILPRTNMSKEEYYSDKSTTINHFYEKLFLLTDLMNTETAKKIAKERHEFMENYIDEFLNEWEGKC